MHNVAFNKFFKRLSDDRHWEKIQFHKFQDRCTASGRLCRFLGGRNFRFLLLDLRRWDFGGSLNFRAFLGDDFKGSPRYNCARLKVEFSSFTSPPSFLFPTFASALLGFCFFRDSSSLLRSSFLNLNLLAILFFSFFFLFLNETTSSFDLFPFALW